MDEMSEYRLYQYKSLNERTAFRLLRLSTVSETDSDQYGYSLVHTTLDEAPAYETLSYVWKTPLRDWLLPLHGGSALRITSTLAELLPRIEHHCATGYIFIDQVCINQDDVLERNQQVALMGQIYADGSEVLVWPGVFHLPPGDPSDSIRHSTAEMVDSDEENALGTHFRPFPVIRGSDGLTLRQLYEILSSKWFSRGWVFQEVVLSKSAKFILPHRTLSLAELYDRCQDFETDNNWDAIEADYAYTTMEIRQSVKTISRMFTKWFQRYPRPHTYTAFQTFEGLLSEAAPVAEVSDPRDRIYAFLGLNNNPSLLIQPDYRLSVEEVFCSATAAIIQGTHRLDIFEHLYRQVEGDSERPFIRRHPTWVPNLHLLQRNVSFSKSSARIHNFGTSLMYPHTGACSSTILTAHGKLIDRVLVSSDLRLSLDRKPHIPSNFDEYTSIAVTAWNASRQRYPKPSMHSVLDALFAQGHWEGSSDLLRLLRNKGSQITHSSHVEYPVDHSEPIDGTAVSLDADIDPYSSASPRTPLSVIDQITDGRYLFMTELGRLALGCTLEPGDLICILHGCSNPVALRDAGEGRYYVQETCFLEGWMDPWTQRKIYWREDDATRFTLI